MMLLEPERDPLEVFIKSRGFLPSFGFRVSLPSLYFVAIFMTYKLLK